LRGERKQEEQMGWQTDWVHQLEKPDVSCRVELPRQQHQHVMIWKREKKSSRKIQRTRRRKRLDRFHM
jgi:hypothetical protein